MGWTYDELLELPVDVYSVLVDALNEEAAPSRK
jgi:transcription elongation factor Elf1